MLSPPTDDLGPILIAVFLIVCLAVKELAGASQKRKWRVFAAYANVVIVPLLVVFIVNIVIELYRLLQ